MDFNDEDTVYKVAANLIPGVGAAGIRKFVTKGVSLRELFLNTDSLVEEGAITARIADAIRSGDILDKAKAQIDICLRHHIEMLYFLDHNYPRRLAQCEGAPALLYALGKYNMDSSRTIGIVGTRSCDSDGKNNIFSLIEKLKEDNINVIIISGLATGADTYAHQAALQYGLPTVAVLGHGLNMVYPAENRKLAGDIVHSGGALITEYYYGQVVNKNNFPRRNRIIAGLCDALIVAQSKIKGGALITADEARKFRREVFAFPGRTTDRLYSGCNYLITNNMATLISNADDLEKMMGWTSSQKKSPVQTELNLMPLSPEEVAVIDVLRANGPTFIDTISAMTKMPMHELSSLLLSMEFKDLVTSLPGKQYEAR
ncbi:MAG: DNA-processing protein DprA [Bacteroidales bacterium]|nr:DNA-processing protein DprA [Bacteroidales bacterium]